MSISGVIIVNHSSDVRWVVPEITKSSRYVVTLCVVLVGLISEPGCEEGETFSDILGVRVHEHK